VSPFAPLSVYKNRISEGATLILTLGGCAWQLPVTALARSRLLQGLVPGLLQKVI